MDSSASTEFKYIAYTAAVGLFRILQLPSPWENESKSTPLIINGASGAVGAFAVKLAKLSPTITPIIGIAGDSADFAKSVGCDVVLDYRSPTVAEDLASALDGKTCLHVFDSSPSVASTKYLSSVVKEDGAKYTFTTGIQDEQKKHLKAFAECKQIWYVSTNQVAFAY
jgi:NADPH2:quinone reductase